MTLPFSIFRTSSESNSDSEPELPADVGFSSAKQRLSNNNGGKKKKKRKRQQKYGKSISAPSKIQTVQSGTSKRIEYVPGKENKSKAMVVIQFFRTFFECLREIFFTDSFKFFVGNLYHIIFLFCVLLYWLEKLLFP